MRHKRVVVARYGGPDVPTVIEEDAPLPNAGEVRVRVLAADVSLPDILAREGVHPETPRLPDHLNGTYAPLEEPFTAS